MTGLCGNRMENPGIGNTTLVANQLKEADRPRMSCPARTAPTITPFQQLYGRLNST